MFRLKTKIRTRENKSEFPFFANQRFIFGATLVVFKQYCLIEKYIIIIYALGSVHENFDEETVFSYRVNQCCLDSTTKPKKKKSFLVFFAESGRNIH